MVVLLPPYQPWMGDARCRHTDVDLWFAPDDDEPDDVPNHPNRVDTAKRFCVACPVVDQCLDYALTYRQTDGIWGGLTEPERRTLIRDGQLPLLLSS